MSKLNLNIPSGKRTPKYRFLEILPGALSYGGVILLVILSLLSPILGAIYLLFIISITLVRAIAVAYRTYGGYKAVDMAEKVNWIERCDDLENPHEAYERLRNKQLQQYNFAEHVRNLKAICSDPEAEKNYSKPSEVYHAVIMVAYNEGIEIMQPSIEAVRDTDFPNERIIFVLGYEERGGEEIEKNVKYLKNLFKDTFKEFIIVKHPDGIKGEIAGKGPNLCCAAEELSKYVARKHINRENVMITSIDSDNQMHKKYLDSVSYEFCARDRKLRQRRSYQPVCLFMNNIWDAAAPMRVIAMGNSFFNIIQTMRPHLLWNFASHSQPLAALEDMDFWSKRTIVEDWHQYWRSYFFFKGDYDTVAIRIPIYQDAVIDETVPATLKAQFVQLRRWAYGASDVAYVGNLLFNKNRDVPFWKTFVKFLRLLDSHVTRAMLAPIVAFGGWVPMLTNMSTRGMVAFNLPMVVSTVQTIAVVGALTTIIVSLKILPTRPKKYGKAKNFAMIAQWIFSPLVALCYTSASAYVAQTKLMLGHYMEKFDVTKKVVKS